MTRVQVCCPVPCYCIWYGTNCNSDGSHQPQFFYSTSWRIFLRALLIRISGLFAGYSPRKETRKYVMRLPANVSVAVVCNWVCIASARAACLKWGRKVRFYRGCWHQTCPTAAAGTRLVPPNSDYKNAMKEFIRDLVHPTAAVVSATLGGALRRRPVTLNGTFMMRVMMRVAAPSSDPQWSVHDAGDDVHCGAVQRPSMERSWSG